MEVVAAALIAALASIIVSERNHRKTRARNTAEHEERKQTDEANHLLLTIIHQGQMKLDQRTEKIETTVASIDKRVTRLEHS